MRADDVKVGVTYDATGPVAMQGVPYAKGAQAAIQSINVNGGVNGKNITAMAEDYGYQIPRAVAAYKKLKGAGVGAIRGFGSGDTEVVMDTVARDHIPWFCVPLRPPGRKLIEVASFVSQKLIPTIG
jgi:branched-chain amino acid transport system substrate-binding protein